MPVKVAINGYGRIGRNILRALYEGKRRSEIQVVAINDLGDAKTNAHLTRYDTAHGPFPFPVGVDGDSLVVDGVNLGSQTTYTFSNVTANHTIAAYFSVDVFTITASANGNGSVTPAGVTNVNYDGSQAYTIAANVGHHLDSVLVDGVNQGAVTSYTFSNVVANHTIEAFFSIDVFTVTASVSGNGSLTPAGLTNVNYDGSQAYTIAANIGHHVDSVLVDGVNQGAITSHTFSNVVVNHAIEAFFSIKMTVAPHSAAFPAAIMPLGPPPITTTSQSSSFLCMGVS